MIKVYLNKTLVVDALRKVVERSTLRNYGHVTNDGYLYTDWSNPFVQKPVGSVLAAYDDTYTVVILLDSQLVGVAKRNPTDPISPERGIQIALHRALRRFVEIQQEKSCRWA